MGAERQSGVTPSRPRSGESIADRMLDVAVERIAADGLQVGLEGLRMEEVIEAAGVSRATAYRRWSSRDAFVADVLVETVRRTSLLPEAEEDVAVLVALARRHRADFTTEQGRRDLVVEALRLSVDGDLRRILGSPGWRTFLALSAGYPGLPAGAVQDAVGAALRETSADLDRRRAAVYANLGDLIGYRPTPPDAGTDGYLVAAQASGVAMNGIVLRCIPDPGWLDRRTPQALFGASVVAPWSAPEQHLVSTLLAHLEPDPTIAWDEDRIAAALASFEGQVAALYGRAGEGLN